MTATTFYNVHYYIVFFVLVLLPCSSFFFSLVCIFKDKKQHHSNIFHIRMGRGGVAQQNVQLFATVVDGMHIALD